MNPSYFMLCGAARKMMIFGIAVVLHIYLVYFYFYIIRNLLIWLKFFNLLDYLWEFEELHRKVIHKNQICPI